MNQFNIFFLIPGYLPPGKLVEPDSEGVSSSAPVAMQWNSGLIQQPWQAYLEQVMGFSEPTGLQLPMARLMNEGHKETSGLVCADPIHLQADRDTAKLIPAEMLGLSEEESTELVTDLNAFLMADNLVLSRSAAGGWYLEGMDASQLASFPPAFLANRNASAYMPAGEDSGQWRRLMTEIQMLLHTHPVNERREQQGKLPVNSLWFWGGAALYTSSVRRAVDKSGYTGTVYADDAFARAVCVDLQVVCKSLSEFDPMRVEEAVVVDTRIAQCIFARDEPEMHKVIEQIDQQWLKPLNKRIHQGQVQQLVMFNEDGDKGVLTKDLLVAQLRSENRLLRAFHSIKMPRIIKRWFNGTKQV